MNGQVDEAVHSTIRQCIAANRRPVIAILAPFTMLHYQRELLPDDCDMVSAIAQVVVLEQGHRVPVTTRATVNGHRHTNTTEGSVDLISLPMEPTT